MKKLFLSIALALGATFTLSAQEGLRAGVHLGLPVGDAADISSFNLGLDVAYFFWKPIDKLEVGVATGYTHYIGKDKTTTVTIPSPFPTLIPDQTITTKVGVGDFGFIPVAVTGEYALGKQFVVGTDLGVAISTKSGIDTGFYFQPKVGWNISDFQVQGFVKGISSKVRGTSNSTFVTLGIGGQYKF
ncbi:hypothetical protein O2K51_00175 [Apibacter raozihei]|uniref:hypothetical protein n=1 Tax=Apibacter raozihei TaxID=2500547 RepID=UPI000FE3AF09|nr:hypothetical protein [Apibacter raozihei]